MSIRNSRRGFYVASPFLGFFFFLITTAFAVMIITENMQELDKAHASEISDVTFSIYSLSADASDVYLQDYLQSTLDRHDIMDSSVIKKEITDRVTNYLEEAMYRVYKSIYEKQYSLSCTPKTKSFSGVYVNFNGDSSRYLLKDAYPAGNTVSTMFGPLEDTTIFPSLMQYGLNCTSEEPPIKIGIPLVGRWYYLNAGCICCQSPPACDPSSVSPLRDFITDCGGGNNKIDPRVGDYCY